MQITKRPWGMFNGKPADLYELDNGVLCARVSNYGGVIQSLLVKNGSDEAMDVVLGYDTLEEYIRSDTFFGALVGPIADRLADGRCIVNGEEVRFPLNAGPDSMHSADFGFHCRLWDCELLPDGIALVKSFTPGEVALPGNLHVRVCYRLKGNALRLEYTAHSDCETALSFTNHSYFTLNGGRDHCREHILRLSANEYAQTMRETDPICTGETLPVAGTPLDLRAGCRLKEVLSEVGFDEIRTGGGIDHYFPVEGEGMREFARLICTRSRLAMRCRSTAPGMLVYTANGLEAVKGKQGAVYGKNWAVCIETESFPNAVNLPRRRAAVLLEPGKKFSSETEYVFELF